MATGRLDGQAATGKESDIGAQARLEHQAETTCWRGYEQDESEINRSTGHSDAGVDRGGPPSLIEFSFCSRLARTRAEGFRAVTSPRSQPAQTSARLFHRPELSAARNAARSWSATVSDKWRIDQAAAFAWTALEAYGNIIHPSLKLSSTHRQTGSGLDVEAWQLARGIGQEATFLSVPDAIHYLTSLYPAMLPERRRSEIGAFYTPPCLANRLLDLSTEAGLDWRSARVLDPASGGGAFLVHAAARMRAAYRDSEPAFILSQIGNRLLGLEIDAHAAALAQAALEILLGDLILASGRTAPSMLRVCDTMEETPDAKFDLVIGNPPYGRVTLSKVQRDNYARGLYGHANLYGIFTDIAIRWAKTNGLIAYLTPTSMLGGQYFAALRGLLASDAPPIAIDFVQARKGVFEDVLQETFLALYRRGGETQRIQVHYLQVGSETEAKVVRNGTVGLPEDPRLPWLAPRDPKHSELVAHVEGMPNRLNDWGYEVATGPLVWNRHKAQLVHSLGHHCHPLVWAEAVTSDGRFVFRAEKRNHAPYFKVKAGDGWLLVEQRCVLVQRTTAKEQARRLIAAELPEAFVREHGGVIVENHLNMVRPKAPPKVSATAVAAILNSRIVDQVFRCISGSVAVSAFELGALPIPSVEAMQEIERMLTQGISKAELETAIAALYGQPG